MSLIKLESILRTKENGYYPQTFLEECKYDVKEIDVLIMALKKAHLMNQIMNLIVELVVRLIVILTILMDLITMNQKSLLRNLIIMNLKSLLRNLKIMNLKRLLKNLISLLMTSLKALF